MTFPDPDREFAALFERYRKFHQIINDRPTFGHPDWEPPTGKIVWREYDDRT